VNRSAVSVAALLTAAVLLTACGDEGGSPVVEAEDDGSATTAASTTTTAPEPLLVLVSNDDGYAAAGIATLVDALEAQPDVEVVVVAPDGNRSGSGGRTTPGGTTGTEVTMANGHPAVAVAGFPADAVAHAIDVLGVEPDLVVSGINEGQNLGPVVDVSGTVGAARVAATRGIPAVAVSAGMGTPAPDYDAAAEVVVDWFVGHRDDLEGATADQVVNINVPTCAADAEPRDVVEVASATDAADRPILAADVDCTGTGPVPADDLDAFNAGFGVITVVAAAPA
jgi:5'-nucleotidase